MNSTQYNQSLANICMFCGDLLTKPSLCTFCGFKFCEEHKSTENHQCIKTRYSEYIKKNSTMPPNVTTGKFRVVCEMCGFNTSKGVSIEYAGEELIQHTQIVGCSDSVFLEEVNEQEIIPPSTQKTNLSQNNENNIQTVKTNSSSNESNQTSVVDQIIKLSSLKEKGMISEDEFRYIKSELIKKLQ